jgi:hypothetical protein
LECRSDKTLLGRELSVDLSFRSDSSSISVYVLNLAKGSSRFTPSSFKRDRASGRLRDGYKAVLAELPNRLLARDAVNKLVLGRETSRKIKGCCTIRIMRDQLVLQQERRSDRMENIWREG